MDTLPRAAGMASTVVALPFVVVVGGLAVTWLSAAATFQLAIEVRHALTRFVPPVG